MGALDAASMGHMLYVNLWHAPEIALFIVVARHLVSPAARPAFVLLQAGCFCAVALTGLFGPYYLALEVLLALVVAFAFSRRPAEETLAVLAACAPVYAVATIAGSLVWYLVTGLAPTTNVEACWENPLGHMASSLSTIGVFAAGLAAFWALSRGSVSASPGRDEAEDAPLPLRPFMPFVLAQALLLMVAAVCTLTFLDGAPLVIVVMTALAAPCLLADGLLLVIMRRAERLACERWYAEEQLHELSRQAAANRDALERAASVSRARHRLRNRLIDVCDLVGRGEDAQALAELDDLELGIRGGRDE